MIKHNVAKLVVGLRKIGRLLHVLSQPPLGTATIYLKYC